AYTSDGGVIPSSPMVSGSCPTSPCSFGTPSLSGGQDVVIPVTGPIAAGTSVSFTLNGGFVQPTSPVTYGLELRTENASGISYDRSGNLGLPISAEPPQRVTSVNL